MRSSLPLFACSVLLTATASNVASATTISWAANPTTNLETATDVRASVPAGVTVSTHTTQFGGLPLANVTSSIITGTNGNNGVNGYIQDSMTATAVPNGTQGQTTTFTFSEPVYNLTFTVNDLDGGPTCTCGFNDIVDFNSDAGLPTKGTPAIGVTYNAALGEAAAIQNVGIGDTTGDITVNWAGPVSSVTLKHIAGPNAAGPSFQLINIGPLSFTNGPKLTLSKTSAGGVGTFNFTTTNVLSGTGPFTSTTAASTLTTATAGTTVTAATPLKLYPANAASTTTETAPGWIITPSPIVCTDSNTVVSGNTSPFTATASGNVVTLAAANTKPGAVITCNITNAKRPTVQVAKTTLGGTGTFNFSGDNGYGFDTVTTATAGTSVSGVVQTLTNVATTTTLTETIPAGWVASAGSCSGTPAANVTFNPTATATTATLVLNPAATAATNALVCTFTNSKLPTLTLNKISTGGTGAFTFNGDNGFGTQVLTTATAGTVVSGSPQILAAAATKTTITETQTTAFIVSSIACTGLGGGGTATPNLATGQLVLDAAATAIGATIDCTYTNAKAIPNLVIAKSFAPAGPFTLGQTVTYTYVISNTGNVPVQNVQVKDLHGTPGALVPVGGSGISSETLTVVGTSASTNTTLNDGIWDVLAPGASVSFTWAHAVTQAEIDHG